MLFIVLFAIIASFMFRKELMQRGYQSKAAGRFPLIAGAIGLVLMLALRLLTTVAGKPLGIHPDMIKIFGYLSDFFVLALFIAAIAKNWLMIKRLPPGKPRNSTTEG